MELEERKRILRESIAKLQQKVKQQEEDKELRELMQMEQELKRKLSNGGEGEEVKPSKTKKHTGKIDKMKKKKYTTANPQAELQNLDWGTFRYVRLSPGKCGHATK